MIITPHCVFVVLDGEFGARISELLPRGPVWMVNTPTNKDAAKEVWTDHPTISSLEGVTIFDISDNWTPERSFIYELDTIDLHHGSYSADPPYTEIEVIGSPVTENIRMEMAQYGFDEFHITSTGFRAVRPMPTNDSSKF